MFLLKLEFSFITNAVFIFWRWNGNCVVLFKSIMKQKMTEQLRVTTENQVSIISQNPFYIDDLFLRDPALKCDTKANKTKSEINVNRSVNIVLSLEI